MIKNNFKKTLISFVFLIVGCFAFSQNISLYIGEETYQREIPSDYEGACELIYGLVDMHNNANSEYMKRVSESEEKTKVYVTKINELEKEVEKLKNNISNAENSNSKVEKDINKMTSINDRFEMGIIVGPAFNLKLNEVIVGTHIEALANYRLIKNFHIGANVFFSAFNSTFDAGAGLYLGLGLY